MYRKIPSWIVAHDVREEESSMARSTLNSNGAAGNDASARPARGSTPSTRRWVKVFGIVAVIVLVVLGVVQHLLFGGMAGYGHH